LVCLIKAFSKVRSKKSFVLGLGEPYFYFFLGKRGGKKALIFEKALARVLIFWLNSWTAFFFHV